MARTITIDPAAPRTNATLQAAVDSLGASGEVRIPPGVYDMRNALHLRSGIRVVGAPGAVLRKMPAIESLATEILAYGHREVVLAEPQRFAVGDGIYLRDDLMGGFHTTVATVIARQGASLFIDRPFTADYLPARHGRAQTLFPLIAGYDIADAHVEGLTLEGADDAECIDACRGGGVYLLGCQRVHLHQLEIRRYRGDGISFQQCCDIWVTASTITQCAGNGLHPGSGSVRYVLQDNDIHHNGGYGIFYCLRTTHSRCQGNRIHDNDGVGISVGERDTDHLILDNTISDNGKCGIDFRLPRPTGGDRTVVAQNTLATNCRLQGECEIEIAGGLSDVCIVANHITVRKKAGVLVSTPCRQGCVVDNDVHGGEALVGTLDGIARSRPAPLPPAGPATLPLDGAMHLGIATLAPWTQPPTPNALAPQ